MISIETNNSNLNFLFVYFIAIASICREIDIIKGDSVIMGNNVIAEYHPSSSSHLTSQSISHVSINVCRKLENTNLE